MSSKKALEGGICAEDATEYAACKSLISKHSKLLAKSDDTNGGECLKDLGISKLPAPSATWLSTYGPKLQSFCRSAAMKAGQGRISGRIGFKLRLDDPKWGPDFIAPLAQTIYPALEPLVGGDRSNILVMGIEVMVVPAAFTPAQRSQQESVRRKVHEAQFGGKPGKRQRLTLTPEEEELLDLVDGSLPQVEHRDVYLFPQSSTWTAVVSLHPGRDLRTRVVPGSHAFTTQVDPLVPLGTWIHPEDDDDSVLSPRILGQPLAVSLPTPCKSLIFDARIRHAGEGNPTLQPEYGARLFITMADKRLLRKPARWRLQFDEMSCGSDVLYTLPDLETGRGGKELKRKGIPRPPPVKGGVEETGGKYK